jgi:midasin
MTNPLRSLGDALREVSQRFNEILESNHESQDQTAAMDDYKPAQVEYLQNDDSKEDMQALGPARQDEVARLSELNIADEDEMPAETVPMDVDDEQQNEPLFSQPEEAALFSLKAEATSGAPNAGTESILTSTDIKHSQGFNDADLPLTPKEGLVSKEEEDEADMKLELAVREWQARGHPSEEAERIWRQYESLTHDLSYALCEQLRLILEPTQATRLRGDYRTGKRLNMKKIIPYIASEYTKDKIWLRRTRPSQREYQVLIALDDSRSMAESHSVHLAFQTLALVSKALIRLEVGDVGIAKFGQSVEVLHGFESGPFTDQAGSKIIDAFRFDQKATQVLSLLETSLSLLEQARERRFASSSTASDLWQMELIISDGVCQDHERLRTILRKAEEQRVMVVFIILDSLHSSAVSGPASASTNQSSIVSMNQVAYKDINGRMELSVTRYLDTFPFEYYVVVRDVEALPEVLSSTLKQFFERISEE